MALGLLRALYEAGRRVPDDVSVVGYDDIPEAAHLLPPLTTVRTDFPEIGTRSLHLLLSQLDGPPEAGRRPRRTGRTDRPEEHGTGPGPLTCPRAPGHG